MKDKQDFYALLGLMRNASAEEIRKAYFKAAQRLHPDRNTAPGETEFFLEIQQAYETLSNPKKRFKYDSTLPPEKPAGIPVDQRVLYSRQSLIHMAEPQLIYAYMEFARPADSPPPPSPSLNLCLVLDRSTSMKGANMDVVKDTAIQIMRKMKPQDIFSVIAFSDRAEEIIPASRRTDLTKLEARIHMLQPSGGTEIFSGLDMGFSEIIKNMQSARVNHIILLTDGRTYGDEEKCIALAHQASDQGIGISGLGIGSEWNDEFLDVLASTTGGSSMYVSNPQDIQKTLLNKYTRLALAYAQDTRLDYKIPEGIELRYAFRIQPESGELAFENPMVLGPITTETNLQILMEFIVQPQAVLQKEVTLLDGELAFNLAEESTSNKSIPIRLIRLVSEEAGTSIPSAEIVNALSHLRLYRLQEQARQKVLAGEYNQASENLHNLATHLLSQGERDLARTALMEAEHIQQNKSFSQQGRKEIKYGTRALVVSGRSAEDQ